jgi:3-oxoacyl-[acyl-carrier-protein] synthase-1
MWDGAACALRAVGLVSALGVGVEDTWLRLVASDQSRLTLQEDLIPGRRLLVGAVRDLLPALPEPLRRYRCRNNELAFAALRQIEQPLRETIALHGPERVGVVMGTSTSGIAAAEAAVAHAIRTGVLPSEFDGVQLEPGGLAEFVSVWCGVRGPVYTISTACSSGAKAVASARALLALGACDAVIAGGADSLCRLTANGFHALQAIASGPTNPFSVNRQGLTLGEGAAVFLMTREQAGIQLVGAGEAGDAFHMSAPDPHGLGAERAMRTALDNAGMPVESVHYLNLHGTGTPLNDAMESQAVHRVFGSVLPCSSTKPLVGHTLGASGALELAFCWMMLAHWRDGRLPLLPHHWDGMADPELPVLRLTRAGDGLDLAGRAVVMSNSFGFGGNNCSLLVSAAAPC